MSDTINTNNAAVVPEYKSTTSIIQLVLSFLLSFLCCGGIVGAVFAILSLVEGSKVKTFVQEGNMQAAYNSLEQANKWTKFAWIFIAIFMAIIAIIAIVYVIYFVFILGVITLDSVY